MSASRSWMPSIIVDWSDDFDSIRGLGFHGTSPLGHSLLLSNISPLSVFFRIVPYSLLSPLSTLSPSCDSRYLTFISAPCLLVIASMGCINIEIPDELHDNLRESSRKMSVPMKYLIIDAIENEYGDDGS